METIKVPITVDTSNDQNKNSLDKNDLESIFCQQLESENLLVPIKNTLDAFYRKEIKKLNLKVSMETFDVLYDIHFGEIPLQLLQARNNVFVPLAHYHRNLKSENVEEKKDKTLFAKKKLANWQIVFLLMEFCVPDRYLHSHLLAKSRLVRNDMEAILFFSYLLLHVFEFGTGVFFRRFKLAYAS